LIVLKDSVFLQFGCRLIIKDIRAWNQRQLTIQICLFWIKSIEQTLPFREINPDEKIPAKSTWSSRQRFYSRRGDPPVVARLPSPSYFTQAIPQTYTAFSTIYRP